MMSTHEKTFLDIRVFHPNAPSYKNKSIEQLYTSHEQEKKRAYNERVLQVEKGSFTPIVMSTAGGMSKEAAKHHRRIAQLIADKRKEEYSHVMSYLRTRLRFNLLKSTLVAIRGIRGRKAPEYSAISNLSFNLVPRGD